jgi:hypothetical protein
MAETLLEKAQRMGIKPAGRPDEETLIQKAQRLGIQPANATPPAPVVAPPSKMQQVTSGVATGFKQAGQAGVGALKSIPAAVDQVSQLGQRALGGIAGLFSKKATAPVAKLPDKITTPTGTDQKAGFLGGQLAQTFALPEKAITKAVSTATTFPKLGKLAPFITGTAKALTKAVTGAATAKVQGASDKAAGVTGAISGGLSAVGNVLGPILKRSAETSYSKALAPTTKANKAITDKVVPGLIEKKTVALTRQSLMNKAGANADTAGEALDSAYDKLPKDATTDWKPVFENIAKAKEEITVNGVVMDVGRHNALNAIQKDLLDVVGGGVKEARKPVVSVETARKVRQILDRSISQKGKVFGLTGNETDALAVQKIAANSIRSELAKDYPDIAKLNKEFSFWNNVREVVGDTIQRTKSQTSVAGELAGDTGAVVGATIGGTVGTVAAAGVVGKLLNATVKSTAWRTVSAVTKNTLAKLLSEGDVAKATALLEQISRPLRSR